MNTSVRRIEARAQKVIRERVARLMEVMKTAGYAAFGAAFFEPVVDGDALRILNYALAVCGVVALAITVWYAPDTGDDVDGL